MNIKTIKVGYLECNCYILNINNNTMNIFNKIKGNKLLLINKIDLISKDLNKDKILRRIKDKDALKIVFDIINIK